MCLYNLATIYNLGISYPPNLDGSVYWLEFGRRQYKKDSIMRRKVFIDEHGTERPVGPCGFIPRSAWRKMRKRKETPGTIKKKKKLDTNKE